MKRLEGKVAVITGAGSGIGRASAKLFVAEGARVVVAEIDTKLGEASAREAGPGAVFLRTDVTDEKSVKQMVGHAREVHGRIDILLNCAGGSIPEDKPVTDVDPSVWDHTINLDMKGDRKSTRLNSSHMSISYAVFCLKKKTETRFTS